MVNAVRLVLGMVAVTILVLLGTADDVAAAETGKVTGMWVTVDEKSGERTSQLKVWEKGGTLYGKIVKLLNPETPNPVCSKCSGNFKNKPIEGMTIMWGLKASKDGEWWDDGHILDPENGKVYSVKLRSTDSGRTLEVRGYLGISLLGRTQIWQRLK